MDIVDEDNVVVRQEKRAIMVSALLRRICNDAAGMGGRSNDKIYSLLPYDGWNWNPKRREKLRHRATYIFAKNSRYDHDIKAVCGDDNDTLFIPSSP